MTSIVLLVCMVMAIYILLYTAHRVCKTCLHAIYEQHLTDFGLEIKPWQVKWYTRSFNRIFCRLGMWRPALVHVWFVCGSIIASTLVLPSMVLLAHTLASSLTTSTEREKVGHDRIVLQPLLPGVNVPLAELGYYFITLLQCSIIHEAGHAIAAVREDVRVLGFGMLVLFLIPAAFVDLPTDQLLSLRPVQQLRIFSAGVWHNLVMALLAYCLLLCLPYILFLGYETGNAVTVTWVEDGSSVRGPTGLEVGDVIESLGSHCTVKNVQDWHDCLVRAGEEQTISWCMDKERLSPELQVKPSEESNVVDCCSSENYKSSLCFAQILLPGDEVQHMACLSVRSALEKSEGLCNQTQPCQFSGSQMCMQPSLSNSSRLFILHRRNKIDFLFVGTPLEIYQSTIVSNYVPMTSVALPDLPGKLETLLRYTTSFSAALVVLNVVPCFFLDGHHMTRVLVDITCGFLDKNTRSVITLTFTIVGSSLLLINVCVGLCQFF